jgi:hypothetical protein
MSARHEAFEVSDLILERYRLGELPPAELERVEQRLSQEGDLRERLRELVRSDEEIVARYPPARLAEGIGQRLATRRAERSPGAARIRFGRWAVPAAVGVAVAILLVVIPHDWGRRSAIQPDATNRVFGDGDGRIKGLHPTVTLYRKTQRGSEILKQGDAVQPDDLIRVGYTALGRRYGVILSIDGRGVVTLHLPKSGGKAARLLSSDRVLLESAYELDDAPWFEQFYFVTSNTPFDTARIVEAASRAVTHGDARPAPSLLALPPGFEQSVFLLRKEVGK